MVPVFACLASRGGCCFGAGYSQGSPGIFKEQKLPESRTENGVQVSGTAEGRTASPGSSDVNGRERKYANQHIRRDWASH